MERDDLPESLLALVHAWRMSAFSDEEIIDRLDQLELLADDERLRAAAYNAQPDPAGQGDATGPPRQ
jgi:hypothetical protein